MGSMQPPSHATLLHSFLGQGRGGSVYCTLRLPEEEMESQMFDRLFLKKQGEQKENLPSQTLGEAPQVPDWNAVVMDAAPSMPSSRTPLGRVPFPSLSRVDRSRYRSEEGNEKK